ncbi:MAG: hypothetical protein U9P36_08430, partial [Thermodesulfobacteriota bacterium]|nr:hypothetical protein [Thermodesulfobacteriota bacterium]
MKKNPAQVSEGRDSDLVILIFLQTLTRIFHEHFAHFKVTSVNHMIKLRIIPYFKFAKCSPKASRC